MKTVISKTHTPIIVIFALFLLGSCLSLRDVPGSSRGNNTVLIITQDHPDVAYRKMGQILTERGFSIANSDREMGTISTAPGSFSIGFLTGDWEGRINVVISGSDTATIALSGTSRLSSEDAWRRIEDRGGSHTPPQAGWVELHEIAQKYEGAEIAFETR